MNSQTTDTKANPFLYANSQKLKALAKAASNLGIQNKDIPSVVYHIDKLANIIIDSYIKTKERKLCKTS